MRTRSLKERFFHAAGFETLAILIVSPLAAWAMHKPLFQMGALAIALSTVALLWNMIYNAGFDRLFPLGRRGLGLRLLHALGFEGGFIVIGLPIAAGMLNISLWQAFVLEFAFFLFFLPYTVAYNWGWDKLRHRWLAYEA
ncbi:multidrug/biocide efflux PACE transporter [Pantoea sp.]|uniref:multidrug/biocide efflux PACE transporter n=1 Tax=Pantoea sp. TaxID=69393 RepID=UPI0028962E3A|nr:multidrug/biocide efflux PACE transporter [Pantoea sp.]